MTASRIEHICDLGSDGIRRLLSFSPSALTLETTAKRQQRIASVDLESGAVSLSRTLLPIIASSTGSHSGARWATATNRDQTDAIVQWQDSPEKEVKSVGI